MACAYKNMLGTPGEGIHSHLGGIAIIDVILMILAAWGIARASGGSMWRWTAILFVVATFLHWFFCVPTAFMKFTGLVEN